MSPAASPRASGLPGAAQKLRSLTCRAVGEYSRSPGTSTAFANRRSRPRDGPGPATKRDNATTGPVWRPRGRVHRGPEGDPVRSRSRSTSSSPAGSRTASASWYGALERLSRRELTPVCPASPRTQPAPRCRSGRSTGGLSARARISRSALTAVIACRAEQNPLIRGRRTRGYAGQRHIGHVSTSGTRAPGAGDREASPYGQRTADAGGDGLGEQYFACIAPRVPGDAVLGRQARPPRRPVARADELRCQRGGRDTAHGQRRPDTGGEPLGTSDRFAEAERDLVPVHDGVQHRFERRRGVGAGRTGP